MEGEVADWKSGMQVILEKALNKIVKIAWDYYQESEEFMEMEKESREVKSEDEQMIKGNFGLEEGEEKANVDYNMDKNYVGFKQDLKQSTGLNEKGNKMENLKSELSLANGGYEKKEEELIINKTFQDLLKDLINGKEIWTNKNILELLWHEVFENYKSLLSVALIKVENGIYYKMKGWKVESGTLLYYIACFDTKD